MLPWSALQQILRRPSTDKACIFASKRYLSSKRWQARQQKDRFTREAVVQGLKSRAAFKLLQIDEKHKIFKSGQTVVDLGYAPGSWSQVAVDRTQPNGRVIGVDIIPAQPPRGVSTIQGNFLAPEIQAYVKEFLLDPRRGRPRSSDSLSAVSCTDMMSELSIRDPSQAAESSGPPRPVDVILSDMSAPWHQTDGFWKSSLSNPYYRMMNTSGVGLKDHTGSMDLCRAALQFSFGALKGGGNFVCKFYQGDEDKDLEKQLRALFQRVHRLKPESSRDASKEAYFVCLGRKQDAPKDAVFPPS